MNIPKFCGRFRKQQELQTAAAATTTDVTDATAAVTASASTLTAQQQRKHSSMEPSMDDALAIGTQMTRKVAERLHCLIAQLQGSRVYT